jgi:GNAT superfamily N-acetyltransferase
MSHHHPEKLDPSGATPNARWHIRPACKADIQALVALRRALFESMGYDDPVLLDRMAEASARYFAVSLPRGEFRAWVAEADGDIVASGGLVIHSVPPTAYNLAGQEGYIMNMYTQPQWRRQGIGTAILRAILDYLREQGISLVSLHATPDGQQLYERQRFKSSNEMRLRLEPM